MTTYILNEYPNDLPAREEPYPQLINVPIWLGTITQTDKGFKAYYCVGDKPTPLLADGSGWFGSKEEAEKAVKSRFYQAFDVFV